MHPLQIIQQPEVIAAAQVLARLEQLGLQEPAIASGWTRGWLMDYNRSDIDIAYVGDMPYQHAQQLFPQVITELGLEHMDWDAEGIWNAQQEDPVITSTARNYILYYVCSIDCVYLASDGQLHDLTGYGFTDAEQGILRMNDFTNMNFDYKPSKLVYLAMEGCRRMLKFGWRPTDESIDLIRLGASYWEMLQDHERQYFYRKLLKKYQPDELTALMPQFAQLGWQDWLKPAIIK